MIHDPPSTEFDLTAFARRIVLRMIDEIAGDREEMKARIMVAYQDGHLSAQEAEEWIVLQGLEGA